MTFEDKLAELVCDYSIQVKEGECIIIRGQASACPLIKSIYKAVLCRGAYPYVRMSFPEQEYFFYKYGSSEVLKMIPEPDMTAAKTADAMISILCEPNTKALTHVDPSNIATHRGVTSVLKDIMFDREAKGQFRWNIVPYPTHGMAQDAEMSYEDYAEFVYRACKLHEDDFISAWKDVFNRQESITKMLNEAKKLRITGEKTDVSFDVSGRKWINCCGTHNMPDGEVFTSPVEDSAEGRIFFDIPTSFSGVEVSDVYMELEKGRVVKAEAGKGEKFLHQMLDTDDGARFIGEIAFGLNDGITIPSKNILFDEKIGGTVHMAVGSSYPEAGGKNKSGLHWDMIKDMKSEGAAYVDGSLVYEKGTFLNI